MTDKPTRRGFIFENETMQKLKRLAQRNRRSLSQMLAFLVDQAYRTEFGTDDLPADDTDSHLYAA